jgi:hypothetical protein
LYQTVKKSKKKRINRIDALNIFATSKSVNYFLEDMKDAQYFLKCLSDSFVEGDSIDGSVVIEGPCDNLLPFAIEYDDTTIFSGITKGYTKASVSLPAPDLMIKHSICTPLTIKPVVSGWISQAKQICIKSKCYDIDLNNKINLKDTILGLQDIVLERGNCCLENVIFILHDLCDI